MTEFKVTDYGAVPDGVTDSTAAFEKALADASKCHGTVLVPSGDYIVGKLCMGEGVALRGVSGWSFRDNGTATLHLRDAECDCMIDMTGSFGGSISGICLDGRGLGENIHGVKVYYGPQKSIHLFTNHRERGIIYNSKRSKRTMTRKTYTAEYKTKLVLEVIREESRLEEIAAANEINPNMLRNWKQEFLRNASSVFSQKESKAVKREEQKKEAALEKEKTKMLRKIGQLTLERDFLQDCFRACDLPIPEYDKSEE